MKVLVYKNDDYNAYIYHNHKNVGDAQQEKRKVHVISSDMISFHQEGEAVVGVIFHQSEINVQSTPSMYDIIPTMLMLGTLRL